MDQTPSRPDFSTRLLKVLSSSVLNVLVGLTGVAVPIVAWASARVSVKNVLLAVETALLVFMVANHLWLRRIYIQLRRANNRAMADPSYFDLVRSHLESELIADFGELADGHLQVYASEVPRLSVLLLKTLVDSPSQPKQVLAADLTTNPNLLSTRREYLAANRRLVEEGGTVQRVFICWGRDLTREDFVRPLLELVDYHRSLGVQCGLAVRDRLRAEQAIDFVVVARSAVLVEEDQGDAAYVQGRSSVYFKSVERWIGRFESIWGHGMLSAPATMTSYESAARPLLTSGAWDEAQARACVDQL
ncbi:hypothetical protein [Actinomadura alba]|uniref:Uncharacterized protein n=1 Tax=Actinomadura alba TaxID=406431 RepID=A0ABR7M1L1_9ACTN|nr:hypothetical protein [Actinomadura alba]MBC6471008.1 hypothetical protein [Actinomadura alba]